MNGIEALQALKDGHIVRYLRRGKRSEDDTLFVFHPKYDWDLSRVVFSKGIHEFAWHENLNNVRFWLMDGEFEIFEEGDQ